MNKKGLIAVTAVILAIIAGAVLMSQNKEPQAVNSPATGANTPETTNTEPKPESTNNTAEQQQSPQSEDTITYTNDGFSQNTLTVKAGSTVTVTNNSSRVLQFDSDPHPEHTDNPELNIGNINPGQSKSVIVNKTGSHGFHNHANDDHTGTLTVE